MSVAHADRLRLNVDTGERGADHAVDHALVAHADIVNLACGGHAGDTESVAVFRSLAAQHGTLVSAHLSYPDREHFGRRAMKLSFDDLARSLDEQRKVLPEPTAVKLHGALYHAADRDPVLARSLAAWLRQAGFATVITPVPGELAEAARAQGLTVWAEAFVERRYQRSADSGGVELMPRTHPTACLSTLPEALTQAESLIADRRVALFPADEWCDVAVDTLCIHSDSPIALELAAALAERLRREGPAEPSS
ncbi:MAG: LamB/YcsF family protein [Planctomycetota bacterium]